MQISSVINIQTSTLKREYLAVLNLRCLLVAPPEPLPAALLHSHLRLRSRLLSESGGVATTVAATSVARRSLKRVASLLNKASPSALFSLFLGTESHGSSMYIMYSTE